MTNNSPKTAMILAAGLGKRMRPLTYKTPKPLLTVSGRSLLDYGLDHLAKAGIEKVIINIHHLANQILHHIESRTDVDIIISDESDELLETGGGVSKALSHIGDAPFFVLNGDILWLDGPTSALSRLVRCWNERKMDALLLLHSTVEAYGYSGVGDFLVDSDGMLSKRPEQQVSPYVFTGVQLLHPRLFKNGPHSAFSLSYLYDRSIAGERLFGIIHDGDWFHIGTGDGLNQAEAYFQRRFPRTRHR